MGVWAMDLSRDLRVYTRSAQLKQGLRRAAVNGEFNAVLTKNGEPAAAAATLTIRITDYSWQLSPGG